MVITAMMLVPWTKSYDQTRQHIKMQRHYFTDKGPSSQSYGFSSGHVWMWELDYKESWVLKTICFWTVVLEKTLLRVLWTTRRSNQSILKEISPEYSWKDWCWSRNSNTLATWCKELIHWKRSWCWERLKAGTEGNDRGWDGWMASPTGWIWVWAGSWSWLWTGSIMVCCSPWGHKESDMAEHLNWTELSTKAKPGRLPHCLSLLCNFSLCWVYT